MASVATHQIFRLDFRLLGRVTFSKNYLIKVMVIKIGNRRHFCLLFWICSSFSSIFFHCLVFSFRPSAPISFSLISFFFPLWYHFCPPFNPLSSFFEHVCFHSYGFFLIYILLLCFFLFLLLRLSFLCAVHPVDGAARSSPAWGSSPFWRAGVPAGGRGTAMSRVQGHVGSEGAGATRSFHAEGE